MLIMHFMRRGSNTTLEYEKFIKNYVVSIFTYHAMSGRVVGYWVEL